MYTKSTRYFYSAKMLCW